MGLVVPELENPIFPAFAQVIEDALARRRYTPVLCTQSPGSLSEDEYVESLLDHGVAGIIFVSGKHADTRADHERYRTLLDRGLPVVFVNGYVAGVPAPFVSADDRVAMDIAVAHLAALGHRRVGLAIGPSRFMPSARKHEGFVAALGTHLGLSATEARSWIAETIFSVEGGAAATEQLLEQGATAVVCGSDMMAIGAIRAARAAGLDVPHACRSSASTTRRSSRSWTLPSPPCASRSRRWAAPPSRRSRTPSPATPSRRGSTFRP